MTIGLNTRIKDLMNIMDEQDGQAICVLSTGYYVMSSANRRLGTFIYTRFTRGKPDFTVHIPFTYADSLGTLIRKGDAGMFKYIDPIITEIP